MIIKHVRMLREDGQFVPMATVVALSPTKIGVAVCNNKDQYNKKHGIMVASARADKGVKTKLPNKAISALVEFEIERIQERAKRYWSIS